MKAVSCAPVSPFSTAQSLFYDFVRGKLSLFYNLGNICATVRGVRHLLELPVLNCVRWRLPLPTWASARVAASIFYRERFHADTTPPPSPSQVSPSFKLFVVCPSNRSAFSLSVVGFCGFSCCLSGASPSFPVHPVATVAATWPISTVPAIAVDISMHALPVSALHVFLSPSSKSLSTANVSSVPDLPIVYCSAPMVSVSLPVLPAPAMVRQSPRKSANINHQSSATEPVASNTPPGGPVIALLHKRCARREWEFAELDELFMAREVCVLESKSSLLSAPLMEVILHSQAAALQTDFSPHVLASLPHVF